MNHSEQINELAAALASAQMEIENATKSSENPHFRSKYADLAEVLNVVRPTFSKNGLAVTQCPSYESGIVSVETVLMHKSGQYIASTISAPVTKQDAQGVGSAITYCRRYALAAVAGVGQEDDDANSAVGGNGQRPSGKPATEAPKAKPQTGTKTAIEGQVKIKPQTGTKTATEGQVKMLYAKLRAADIDPVDFCKHFQVDSVEDLPFDRVTEAAKAIEGGGLNA